MAQIEVYLTVKEAAAILQVSFSTMNRWIKNDEIATIKLGKAKQSCVRITRTDLDAFAHRHRTESAYGYKRPHTVEEVA
jgi:excisionase family DNA binding protein